MQTVPQFILIIMKENLNVAIKDIFDKLLKKRKWYGKKKKF